jgi:hypothetical protein
MKSMWKALSCRKGFTAATLSAGAVVVLAATARVERGREDLPAEAEVVAAGCRKSAQPRLGRSDESAKLKREIRGLSPRQVRDALPETADPLAFAGWGGSERIRLLFRRLGELEGEAALDEVLARYGTGAFTANAMTHALLGWMEVDPAAAMAVFL